MLKRNLDCQLKKKRQYSVFSFLIFSSKYRYAPRPLLLIYMYCTCIGGQGFGHTYIHRYTWIRVQHFHKKSFHMDYGFRGSEYRILQKIMWNCPESFIILTKFNWLKMLMFLYREKTIQFYIWIWIRISETDPDPVTQMTRFRNPGKYGIQQISSLIVGC
jgi:hypothetical protein